MKAQEHIDNMKLPGYRRLVKNDFKPEDQELVDKLSYPINTNIENLYDALNSQLTFSNNFIATVRDVIFTVDSTGKPTNTTSFSLSFTGTVSMVVVGNATNLSNGNIYPTGAPFVSWTQNQTSVVINNVTGLQANQSYKLRLIAFG